MTSRSVVLVLLAALGCGAARPESPAPDLALVRTQLDSLWARYSAAAVAADGDAIVQLYTDSSYLVESGLPTVRGKAALQSVVKEVLSSVRILESSIRPEITELVGDHALQFGEYRDVLQPSGQPTQHVFGRFAAVLAHDSTGAWRVSRLIAVADSTITPTAKKD